MGSKRFKGKPCAYCANGIAQTQGDHVIPRALLPAHLRGNPIKVPCCKQCGDLKSRAEHYAVSALPFGGRQPSALETLEMVGPRLEKNQALARELANSVGQITTEHGDVFNTIRIDAEKIAEFVGFVVRGLAHEHWGDWIVDPSQIHVELIHPEGDDLLRTTLLNKNGDAVGGDLGEGHVIYSALRSVEAPIFTVWRIKLLGGLELAGDEPGIAEAYWTMTGDPRVVSTFREMLREGEE